MKQFITILLGVAMHTSGVFAQNPKVTEYINSLYKTWDSTLSKYNLSPTVGDSALGVRLITQVPVKLHIDTTHTFSSADLKQQVLMEEAKVLKGDIGLGVTATYAYNLDPGIGFEDNLFYDQKFRVGVGMDILKSGLLSNSQLAKIKTNEIEIQRLLTPEADKNIDRYLKWHNIIYQFNLKKIEVLHARKNLAESRVDMATKLNHLKYLSQQELINTVSSHAEIKSMLNIYQSYNDQLATELDVVNQTAIDYPLFDIDYTYSYKLLQMSQPDSVASLMIENIDLKDKAVHEFRLRPFVAYNFYDMVEVDPAFRSYVSVGVTFAAPLNFNGKNKANLREARSNLVMIPSGAQPEIQEDVLSQFYEFRYKLKQFSTFYHKRKLYTELIRQERVKHDLAPLTFNPMSALKILDNLMQIDIELIDLKQQMYLKILNIYTALPYSEANKLIKTTSLENNEPSQGHSNSIYIWSSSILKYDAAVIAHYVDLHPFDRVTISLNTNPEARIKTFKLIDLLLADDKKIELMIGKNGLIDRGFDAYIEKLGTDVDWNKITALHLDVEPHTRDDWHTNKDEYLKKYHELVALAASFCASKNIELGVSIPTHYPEEDIRKIFDKVDRVYFMCYENVKTDFIVRKTNLYPVEKTYIALRTNDFSNRLDMENKFIELNQVTKVAGYVLHDFGSLLEFDIHSINK